MNFQEILVRAPGLLPFWRPADEHPTAACLHRPESSELDPMDIELVRRLVTQYERHLE